MLAIFEVLEQPLDFNGFIIELTEAEKKYIWLLTALDAMRIDSIELEAQKDYHQQIRHSIRSKLFDTK